MLRRIATFLRLDPDEAGHALTLAGILFALTGSYTLVKTARDTLLAFDEAIARRASRRTFSGSMQR